MGFREFATSGLTILDTYRSGWGTYDDTATASTPLTIVADTPKLLTTDKLGPQTDERFLPFGVTTLFSSVNNRVQLTGLQEGEIISIRNDLVFTPGSTNTVSRIQYEFLNSVGASVFTVNKFIAFSKAASVAEQFVVSTPFFIGAAIADGEVEVSLVADSNGTCVVNGVAVFALNRPLE
jgi:hypothetical protein